MQLARQWKEFHVTEGAITTKQLSQAVRDGRVKEMFGSGTAAIVSPIKQIRLVKAKNSSGEITEYEDLIIPLNPKDPKAQAGPLTQRLSDTLMSIQYGEVEHPWSVVVPVKH